MFVARAMRWVLVGLSLVSFAGVSRAAGELDGKTFAVEVTEKGKEAAEAEKDQLIFKDGKFRSPGCDEYGFTEVAYTASAKDNKVAFDAVAKSEKEGEIHWTGTVQGDAVEGSFVWTKSGQDAIEYSFKGSLQKPS